MSHTRRANGFWYADDFMLPYDGSIDVGPDLDHIFSHVMQAGDTFVFHPDGQYKSDNEISLTSLSHLNFHGQDAQIFGTVERNNKFFHLISCRDIEFRDLHIFGYADFDSFGKDMPVGTGSPAVSGNNMLLDTLNESVFIPRATAGPYAFGRDKDGYCRIQLTLSDNNHVANDCQVVVTDGFGTTLETITIPLLTGTSTVYEIRHRLTDPRDRIDWEVKKATGASNTITIYFAKSISPSGFNSLIFNNAGWDFTGSKNFRLFNCSAEGLGGDAIQSSAGGLLGANPATEATISGFLSRCCGRQGVSFNHNKQCLFEDFDIYFPGRSGIDIEPESQGMVVNDMTIRNGRIWSATNAGIACTGWSWINRLEVANVDFYDSGRAAIEGGSRGGKIHGVSSTRIHRDDASGTAGAMWPDFVITGQDMQLSDIQADRGFFFAAETRNDENSVPVVAGGYSLHNFTVSRQALYGAVGVANGVSVTVSGGPGTQQFPVPIGGRGSVHGAVGPAGGLRRASGLDVEMHQDRLPASYGGGIAHTHLWVPGGHDVVNEPMYRVGALSGDLGTAVTLQTSTARTTTGTTTAVDVGEASVGRFRLYVTAISGTLPTLDVAVQQSHDNTTFATIDSFPQVQNTTSTEYSKVIEFRNTARYLRLSYTLAGTSPSFTFSVIGDVNVVGTNLRGISAAVTASASTHAVTFPTRTFSNPTSFALAGTTAGSLTPSTTYFYRVAGRPLRGGPVVALAEQSVALTAGQSAVNLSVTGMEQLAAGVHIAGLTIYRGTTTATYVSRYDVLPRTRLHSVAAGSTVQVVTDLGPTATIVVPFPITQLTLGYPASIPVKAGSFTPADETGYELDTAYEVLVETNWNSGHPYVTSKARTGFTINFPTAAPGDGSGRASWTLIR